MKRQADIHQQWQRTQHVAGALKAELECGKSKHSQELFLALRAVSRHAHAQMQVIWKLVCSLIQMDLVMHRQAARIVHNCRNRAKFEKRSKTAHVNEQPNHMTQIITNFARKWQIYRYPTRLAQLERGNIMSCHMHESVGRGLYASNARLRDMSNSR